jgi:hypothetical protein
MTSSAERYPLTWPAGWKRTPARQRGRAQFGRIARELREGVSRYAGKRRLSVSDALERLQAELDRLGAANGLVSTNVALRLDGRPRSDRGEPADPGAAVYFQLEGKPRCLACDRWDRVADNIGAIAAHIEALRGIDRYGVGTLDQAFTGYTALAPTEFDWWIVLGVKQDATLDQVEEAFRRLAKEHHPDVGGSHAEMSKLTAAREAARAALA